MSRTQLRDSSGRFANGFHRLVDTHLRSGADTHRRTILDDTEPLSMMAPAEAGTGDDKYRYAVAVGALVAWTDREPPTRYVQVQYVDPSREHITTRTARGRLGTADGRVVVSSVDWSTVPRRIAVDESETVALDVSDEVYEAFGDALRAHEEVA